MRLSVFLAFVAVTVFALGCGKSQGLPFGLPTSVGGGSHDHDDDGGLPNVEIPPASGAKMIVFEIANGTGTAAWNTAANPIVAKIGDTVRFVNKDASGAAHGLHTGGSPCPHGNANVPIPLDGFYDCPIGSMYSPPANPAAGMYNHFRPAGTAPVYLRVEP